MVQFNSIDQDKWDLHAEISKSRRKTCWRKRHHTLWNSMCIIVFYIVLGALFLLADRWAVMLYG